MRHKVPDTFVWEYSFDGKDWITQFCANQAEKIKYSRGQGINYVWFPDEWVPIDTLTNFEKALYNIDIEEK